MRVHLAPTDPREDLDRAMRMARGPGSEIILAPGRYWTRGPWSFGSWSYRTQASGVTLRSDGTGRVEIALAPDAERMTENTVRDQRDMGVWWTEPGAVIKGIAFNGNHEAFIGASKADTWYVTTGVRAFGRLQIEDWEVSGMRGGLAKATGLPLDNEAFCLSVVGDDGGSQIGPGLITGGARAAYISALNVGHVGPNLKRSTVRDVTIDLPAGNWLGLGVNQAVHAIRVRVLGGCAVGVYNDTDRTDDVLVEDSEFRGVNRLVSLIAPRAGNLGRTPRGRVHLLNVSALINPDDPGGNARGVELWDQGIDSDAPAIMGPVVIDRSKIDATGTFWAAAMVGRSVHPVVYSHCVLPKAAYVAGSRSAVVMSQCRDTDGNPVHPTFA